MQAATGVLEWQLPDSYQLRFHELAEELAVGGVYVHLYLKDPRFPLRCRGSGAFSLAGCQPRCHARMVNAGCGGQQQQAAPLEAALLPRACAIQCTL